MTDYKRRKIRVLKHFGVYLTGSDMLHLNSLQSEIAIDNWSRSIILANLAD